MTRSLMKCRAPSITELSMALPGAPTACRGLQVSVPIARVDGLPVGLGLIGPPGSDEALLELSEQLMEVLAPDEAAKQ